MLTRSYAIILAGCLILAGLFIHKRYSQIDSDGPIAMQISPSAQTDTASSSITPSNVIFDLNGVLFTINKQQALSQLGYLDVLAYTLSGKRTEDIEDKIFDVLERMRPLFNTSHCKGRDDKKLIPLHNGKPLPHVMRDWMQGELSGKKIIDTALPFIEQLDKENYFSSTVEKKLIRKTFSLFFDARTRSRLAHPLPSGIKLVKKCKQLGHRVFLLSNMDVEFIEALKEKHAELFALFDGIIISADVKKIKPNPDIYAHLLSSYTLTPGSCYLIDDQEENIIGARASGMRGIICDHTDHCVSVCNELRSYGVLPASKKDIREITG